MSVFLSLFLEQKSEGLLFTIYKESERDVGAREERASVIRSWLSGTVRTRKRVRHWILKLTSTIQIEREREPPGSEVGDSS